MPFSLHCFTSSSHSFSIPFVGGSGPSCLQIKSSQSISNKGQLQRRQKTTGQRESGSEQIRVEKPCMCESVNSISRWESVVLSNSPPTQQTVQRLSLLPQLHNRKTGLRWRHSLCPRWCCKAGRGGETVSTEQPWKKENHSSEFLSQSASKCRLPECQDGGEMIIRVNYRRRCILRKQ